MAQNSWDRRAGDDNQDTTTPEQDGHHSTAMTEHLEQDNQDWITVTWHAMAGQSRCDIWDRTTEAARTGQSGHVGLSGQP